MTALAIISLLAGAVLGLHFKVLILVPATLAGLIGAALSSSLLGTGGWMVAMILITVGLEVGYLGVTATRLIIVPAPHQKPAAEPTITDPAF
jgi:hypothetical protein